MKHLLCGSPRAAEARIVRPDCEVIMTSAVRQRFGAWRIDTLLEKHELYLD